MTSCVIDTSAIFVDLQGEPGADEARRWLRHAAISAVNLHELAAKALDKGVPADKVSDLIARLRLTVHPHDAADAIEAGLMREATRALGLGLADRSCLALAKRVGLPAVTADRAWAELGETLGVEIIVVR
ncbi:MAG: type II toxin-antitoxin system VapC family toxin [Pseudomonadota bacterium]